MRCTGRKCAGVSSSWLDIAGNVRKGKAAHQISPVALEAVKQIDAIFDIEREINGLDADARLAGRKDLCRPLVNSLHDWLLAERTKLSRHNNVAKTINYMFEKKLLEGLHGIP